MSIDLLLNEYLEKCFASRFEECGLSIFREPFLCSLLPVTLGCFTFSV